MSRDYYLLIGSMWSFSGGSDVKESVCNAGDPGFDLGQKDPLEKGPATHSSITAWRIPSAIVHGVAKSQTQLSG